MRKAAFIVLAALLAGCAARLPTTMPPASPAAQPAIAPPGASAAAPERASRRAGRQQPATGSVDRTPTEVAHTATAIPPPPTVTGRPNEPTPWPTALTPAYWPTSDWRVSTPEEQGLDSRRLAEVFDEVYRQGHKFYSLLIVRHGYLVVEAYFGSHTAGDRYETYSCTKSVSSALAGIAIAEGKIRGIDERVLDFFPDRKFANPDPRKDALTIRQLLTMTSGLDWPEWGTTYMDSRNPINQIEHSRDWLANVLDRPIVADPGTTFNYDSGTAHVLSAIVQQATGMTELNYARTHLFEPLGIKEVEWYADPEGRSIGGWGLQMRPRDMAKLGLLYLQEGAWDGRQIVPRDWVRASVTACMPAAPGKHYGYQWWIRDFGAYGAEGMNGQYIMVLPAQDTVVVATANITESPDRVLPDLVVAHVLPAVAQAPLAPDPAAAAQLAASIKRATGGR